MIYVGSQNLDNGLELIKSGNVVAKSLAWILDKTLIIMYQTTRFCFAFWLYLDIAWSKKTSERSDLHLDPEKTSAQK